VTDQERAEFEAWLNSDDVFSVRARGVTSAKLAEMAYLAARRTQDAKVRELCGLIKTLHSEELQDRGEVPVLLDDIATLAAQLKEQQDAK